MKQGHLRAGWASSTTRVGQILSSGRTRTGTQAPFAMKSKTERGASRLIKFLPCRYLIILGIMPFDFLIKNQTGISLFQSPRGLATNRHDSATFTLSNLGVERAKPWLRRQRRPSGLHVRDRNDIRISADAAGSAGNCRGRGTVTDLIVRGYACPSTKRSD